MASIGNAGLAALFKMIGAPVTPEGIKFGNAWERAEGGNASFDPFNTTQPFAGATNYNSVGVKNYPTLQAGLKATAQTLLNGHYQKLVQDLRSGKASAQRLATDVADSPWGTGSGVLRVLGSGPVSETPAAKAAAKPIPAQGGSPLAGAPMKQALLQMVMANNQAILGGGTPDVSAGLQLLQAFQNAQSGGGSSASGGGIAAAPGASGAVTGGAKGSVVQAARTMLGTPYVWGGNTPGKGLDCSAFIQQAYAKIGVKLPRTTYDQVKHGQAVSLNSLKPGDAVFTEPGKNGPNHVGMYIGNGMIQESPHTGDKNKIIPLKDFLSGGFVAARRYVK